MTDRNLIRIRPCRPTDIEAMIDLFRVSVRIVARCDYTEAQVKAWAPDEIDHDVWLARYASRQAWVAEIGDDLAGFTDLEPDGHLDMIRPPDAVRACRRGFLLSRSRALS